MLVVSTDLDGRITGVAGRWPGAGVAATSQLTDLVHTRNHDLLERVSAWVSGGGSVERGVGVQVRTREGWNEATVTAVSLDGNGVRWCFSPVLADPMRAAVAAVTEDRDVAAVLDVALGAFADAGTTAWATVHYDRDEHDRYRAVVATTGRDTFRRAVEAATAGDHPQAWDAELPDEPLDTELAAFGDGIKLAGPHAGVGSCLLMAIPAAAGGDAACLAVWSETAGQLQSPEMVLLVRRVAAALTLAFQVEAGRDAQRKLATRDVLTGLWNRQSFFAHLNSAAAKRNCAVACIDIDDFRAINDWHGYPAGDDVLVSMAARLRQLMRPGDVVARVSADEFAVLCVEVRDEQAAATIAERLVQVCDEPFTVAGTKAVVDVSVAMAMSSPERCGPQLFDAAERVLLEVKDEARGSWRLA